MRYGNKTFHILSSPSRAVKGHGSKGSCPGVSRELAGGFVYPRGKESMSTATLQRPARRPIEDPVRNIITHTELSLVLLGFMYYYLIQLPQQQQALTKKEPQ